MQRVTVKGPAKYAVGTKENVTHRVGVIGPASSPHPAPSLYRAVIWGNQSNLRPLVMFRLRT